MKLISKYIVNYVLDIDPYREINVLGSGTVNKNQ